MNQTFITLEAGHFNLKKIAKNLNFSRKITKTTPRSEFESESFA